MPEFVATQDISSGRVHKRYPTESGYATHEADNLDTAGAYRILTETEFAELPYDALCKRCWPAPVDLEAPGQIEPDADASGEASE